MLHIPQKPHAAGPLYVSPFAKSGGTTASNVVSAQTYAADCEPGATLARLEPGQLLDQPARQALAPFIDGLLRDQWLFGDEEAMFRAYRLRYVSLETNTNCNQRCFFCPVSEHVRPMSSMDDGLLERILAQIETAPDLLGVFLNNYNEPFLDRRAGAIIKRLHGSGIKVAINSNGTVPLKNVRPALPAGSIFLLTFNLHTADREKYRRERGRDHFDVVARNINDFANSGVALKTRIAVLGDMSETHAEERRKVADYFRDLNIDIEMYEIMDRAGNMIADVSGRVNRDILWGCEQTGSRPLEHIHILPDGRCVLCCEDYYERHVVGNLTSQSIHEVMSGAELASFRKTIYGFDRPSDDFMCRHCEFSVAGKHIRACGSAKLAQPAL